MRRAGTIQVDPGRMKMLRCLHRGRLPPECLIAAAAALLMVSHALLGQATPSAPSPRSPVAIENTNATFSPTDVNVPIATPARPTVTLPAHLPPTGYLQFEQGFNQANDSPGGTDAQFALNQTTKIALTTRLLVQFVTQPYTINAVSAPSMAQTTDQQPGDLQVGGQAVLHKGVGIAPVVAAGYIRRVRAGASADLDVGSASQSAVLLLSQDPGHGFHDDANLIFSEQNSGPVRRAQFGQSLAVSHVLFEQATDGRLTGVAELSHFTQPFVTADVDGRAVDRANTADLLFAAVYSLRPNLVLDAAFGHGLTSTSTQWQGSFGFTYLLPHRLWKDRHPVPIAVGPFHYRNPR